MILFKVKSKMFYSLLSMKCANLKLCPNPDIKAFLCLKNPVSLGFYDCQSANFSIATFSFVSFLEKVAGFRKK